MLSSRPKACSEVAINYQRGTKALESRQQPSRGTGRCRPGEAECHCTCGKCPCRKAFEVPRASVQEYAPGQKPCPLGLMRAVTPAELTAARRRNSSRAVSWIAKYAGTRATELCKQRWLLNLIGGVEGSYQDTILDLHEERNRLEVSTQQMQAQTEEEVATAMEAVAAADRRAAAAEADAAEQRSGRTAAEAHIAQMQALLQEAQHTARHAAEECAQLHATVLSVSEEEARAQKRLALRSHQLREVLVATKDEARTTRGTLRRQQAAMAGVRRWHEGALRAQAQDFSDAKGQVDAVQRENVALKDRLERMRGELAATKHAAAAAQKFRR